MEDGELLTPVPIWVGLGQFSRGPAESSLWAEPVWVWGESSEDRTGSGLRDDHAAFLMEHNR